MALSSTPSDAPPLLKPLKTLYPLACLLVGPDEASDLLLRVYQKAAEHPPEDRPEDLEEWLIDLLRETSAQLLSPEEGLPNALEEDAATVDPLREDVAKELVENALPIALAACSPHERFRLAVEAFEESGDNVGTGSTEDGDRDVYSILRTELRGVLSAPESALVDDALSDAFLREAVRDLVATRFAPVPSSLRSRIRETLRRARDTEETPTDEEESSRRDESSSLFDRLPSQPHPRALLLALLIGALIVAGGIGMRYVMQSSRAPGPSSTSLVAFSAEQARDVAPKLQTSDRSEAAAYVESTWGRQIVVPGLRGARLQGVGRVRPEGVEIPVFLYADTDDSTRIAIFAYSYALVDQITATATLPPQIREELARRKHLVAKTEGATEGLLWRDRDDIFVAVAPSMPTDSLRARLRP